MHPPAAAQPARPPHRGYTRCGSVRHGRGRRLDTSAGKSFLQLPTVSHQPVVVDASGFGDARGWRESGREAQEAHEAPCHGVGMGKQKMDRQAPRMRTSGPTADQ